ncbi:D-alanyl-D-alanine carboxypeptidase family protein [Spirochaetia bacterium 38H-sp]|uniref:D-alanyl-D-alanine carboxypeptidase family protein n=1 Tax=Rarispira pelagica TaxID=3141764 RepID=A0ABU9UBH2_9SPIR
MRIKTCVAIFIILLQLSFLFAEPSLSARSAILIDSDTKTILFEKNTSDILPAASITKLVTAYIVLDLLDRGEISEGSVTVPEKLAEIPFPPDASLAHLTPGEKIQLDELLSLLLVYSANDAAYALALIIDDSIDAFADRMNALVSSMGYADMHFAEPSGLSVQNRISARSMAFFAADYIKRFRYALARYHSIPYVEYRGRLFYNRNKLLASYLGMDGLKTGYIEESGFNLVATAERKGLRLISVVLGIFAPTYWDGLEERDKQSAQLLDWGFSSYIRVEKSTIDIRPLRIWGGEITTITPILSRPLTATIKKDKLSSLRLEADIEKTYFAPMQNGHILGTARLTDGERTLDSCPIISPVSVERGSIWRIIADFFIRLWWQLTGKLD